MDYENDPFGSGDLVETDDFGYDRIVKETDKAFLLSIDGDKVWIPKSQCEIDKDRKLITIPLWLAEEKEME